MGKQIIWSSKYKIHCVLTKTPLIRPEGTKKALMCLVIVMYYFEERKKSVAAIFGSKLLQKLSDNDDGLVSQFPVLRRICTKL